VPFKFEFNSADRPTGREIRRIGWSTLGLSILQMSIWIAFAFRERLSYEQWIALAWATARAVAFSFVVSLGLWGLIRLATKKTLRDLARSKRDDGASDT
jgi:hypothetical protein